MATLQDKLAVMKAVAPVVAAVMSNLPDDVKPDPEGVDPSMTQANEMGLRLDRTLYAWVCQSYADDTMWPKPPEGFSKLDLMAVAAVQAAGIILNLPDTLPLDVATAKPEVIQHNAAAWRVWRTRYDWICKSIADATMWPDAPAVGGAPVPPAPGGGGPPVAPTAEFMAAGFEALIANAALFGPLADKLKAKFLGG